MTGHQIQFFVERAGTGVNWRLLAANNREAGRGARAHPDEARCREAVLGLRAGGDRLVGRVRRTPAGRWTWELRLDDQVVASSPRVFDRSIRCEQVLAVVEARVLDAPLGRIVLGGPNGRRRAVAIAPAHLLPARPTSRETA